MAERKQQQMPKGARALTFREARELYGVPEHRLRQCRSQRAIDFFKLGRAVFVSEQGLIRFLESRREAAYPQPEGTAVGRGPQ